MDWTVDYGSGPQPVSLPHSWGQDVPVAWEGPAIYRTQVEVKSSQSWLCFEGVSYEAVVFLDGEKVTVHRGIWDAFSTRLPGSGTVDVRVEVTKNGGDRFPVKDVLSGFLPYVFHTFGGIFRPVQVVESEVDPADIRGPMVSSRISIQGSKLFVDGQPFYMRGVLTWGWYPENGHPHPDEATMRRELGQMREMGFNTVKFCLWLPPHRYLELLEEYDMWAWIELPLWLPSTDPERLSQMDAEARRIVRQYRHHDRIIAWTVGCELQETPRDFRRGLVDFIREETGCPLVKDNSGGAEMYAEDLVEFGTFDDFHPYADAHLYPSVLATLDHGPRPQRPILLGEYSDYDGVRDLARLKQEAPYWALPDDRVNAQGIRYQYDLPGLLQSPWADVSADQFAVWRRYSISKGAYIRRKVTEAVRSRADLSGYVITGWRDTPISTSGMVDDAGETVYGPQHQQFWNLRDTLFLIPDRRPPWIRGGNRPGWRDTQCFLSGAVHLRVGFQSDREVTSTAAWRFEGGPSGTGQGISVLALEPQQVVEIDAELPAGKHRLAVKFGEFESSWPIQVFDRLSETDLVDWHVVSPRANLDLPQTTGRGLIASIRTEELADLDPGVPSILCLEDGEGLVDAPFWRECFFDYSETLAFSNRWEWLLGLSTDQFMTVEWLASRLPGCEVLMRRIDTRSYAETAVLVRWGDWLVTTLRPGRQSADQPWQFSVNPAGHGFLREMIRVANQA